MADSFKVYQWIGVGVLGNNLLEERTAGAQYHLVRLDLPPVLTGEDHVGELRIVELLLESLARVLVELLPGQLVSLGGHSDISVTKRRGLEEIKVN